MEPVKPYQVGDRIEHHLMPGFWMTVLDVKDCETPDHRSYKIIDFAGSEDWLCAYDVRREPGEMARNAKTIDVLMGPSSGKTVGDPMEPGSGDVWAFDPKDAEQHRSVSGPGRKVGRGPGAEG